MHRHQNSSTRRLRFLLATAAVGAAALSVGVVAAASAAPTQSAAQSAAHDDHDGHTMSAEDRTMAMAATARYQDVEVAEADGWASSIDTLGCFQDADRGGMGVHFVNDSLMDDVVDIAKPEALVFEMDADGDITGLVAHEYIVPVDAWTSTAPPRLFGRDFHRHPVLPLWVMHAWMWKDNPTGMFSDWNPAVRPCPSGVPIFGVDLPR